MKEKWIKDRKGKWGERGQREGEAELDFDSRFEAIVAFDQRSL